MDLPFSYKRSKILLKIYWCTSVTPEEVVMNKDKEVIRGMSPKDYYTDTRKLQYLHNRFFELEPATLPKVTYTNLGKCGEKYAFSSLNMVKYISTLVEIAENLGLSHEMKFIDSIAIKVNSHFYITNNLKGGITLVGRYHEGSYISSNTIKEIIRNGYNIVFDGTLVFITLENSKSMKDDVLSLKALADRFPKGFN